MIDESLKIFPIGGIEQVTQNMYLYQYGDEMMIVDCGIGFPDQQMPGADVVIPDISYLLEQIRQGKKIVGMVLSHGHDDHIAALPYLLPSLPDFPIYASPLTAGFAMERLMDVGNTKQIIHTHDHEPVHLGEHFAVTPFAITHSVPDTKHFMIETPVGIVYHGTDFKLDEHPVDGILPDYDFMAQVAGKGVKLMLTDCLGVEKNVRVGSESEVGPKLLEAMRGVKGKVIVTLMSSHIHRIVQTMEAAASLGRKVVLVGRSVEQNVLTAAELGFINDEHDVIINKKEIKDYPDDRLVLIVAGCQGQEGSSMMRAINGELREVKLTQDDRVIFSADAIPGNELLYYGAIDNLCIHGIETLYPVISEGLHQSGHARRPELAELLERIHPDKVMPIGGNNRHRVKYFDLVAKLQGYKRDDVLLPAEGEILALHEDGRVDSAGQVSLKPQIVDGLGVGDVGPVVLSDRKTLGKAGIVIVLIKHYKNKEQAKLSGITINKQGYALQDMTIISRGFVFMEGADDVVAYLKKRTGELLTLYAHGRSKAKCEKLVEEGLAESLYKIIQREPMIEVEIVEV